MKFNAADLSSMAQRYRATFVNSLSGYKSANLVGTVDAHGRPNLCIVNSVFHLGAHPPLLGMILRPHTVRRDTLENILLNECYTLNHVNHAIVAQAHQTSARYDAHESEFEEAGLTSQPCDVIPAPYVLESKLKLAMKLVEIKPIEINDTQLVIGQIEQVIVGDNAISEDGFVDLQQLDEVAIVGLDGYYTATQIHRFEYAKPGRPPTVKK
ncbi:MAG: flavin reductase [Aliiglaciecola sp.]